MTDEVFFQVIKFLKLPHHLLYWNGTGGFYIIEYQANYSAPSVSIHFQSQEDAQH